MSKLVALSSLGLPPLSKHVVIHKNHRNDHAVINLQWVSPSHLILRVCSLMGDIAAIVAISIDAGHTDKGAGRDLRVFS